MTITDEMVEKACDAFLLNYDPPLSKRMRAALEAVAPQLIAQGLREAADKLKGNQIRKHNIEHLREAIRARAQELDPQ